MGNNSKYFTIALVILGVMAAATLLAFSEDQHAGWHGRRLLPAPILPWRWTASTESW